MKNPVKGLFTSAAEGVLDEQALMDRVDVLSDRLLARLLEKMDEYDGVEVQIRFKKKPVEGSVKSNVG